MSRLQPLKPPFFRWFLLTLVHPLRGRRRHGLCFLNGALAEAEIDVLVECSVVCSNHLGAHRARLHLSLIFTVRVLTEFTLART